MKKLLKLTNIVSGMAALGLLAACQSTGTTQSAAGQNESLLAQSGFKTVAVTTEKQKAAVSKLPQNTVSAVKHNGKLYYVYPTATNDKIYVGKQQHVNAAQQAQSTMNPAPTMQFQGHGQQQLVVDQFDGFGPMGTAQLGDW